MDKISDEQCLKKAHQTILNCLEQVFPDQTDFSSLEILFNQEKPLSLAEINVGLVEFLVKAIKKNFIHENIYKNLQQQCQRLEATVRNHIKTQQEMKMFIEYLQEKDKKDFIDPKELQLKQIKINELLQHIQSFKILKAQLQKSNLTLLNNNALLQIELEQKKQDIEKLTNNLNTVISNSNVYMKFSPRASCLYSLNNQHPINLQVQNKKSTQFSDKLRQKDDFLKPKLLRQTQAKGNVFTQSRAEQISKPSKNVNSTLYQSLARVQRTTSSLTNNADSCVFSNGQKIKQPLNFMQNKMKNNAKQQRDATNNLSAHRKKKSFQSIPIPLLHKRNLSSQPQTLNSDENKFAFIMNKKKQDMQFGRNQISAYTSNEIQKVNKFQMKFANNNNSLYQKFGNVRSFN